MSSAALRLQRRYPGPRVPRRAKLVLTAIGVAAAAAWLVWTALFHATPDVAGQVAAYTVQSDTAISITITVQRPDPTLAASCRVIAQSSDFQPVGEQFIKVPAGQNVLVDITFTMTTLRRSTSASVKECTLA